MVSFLDIVTVLSSIPEPAFACDFVLGFDFVFPPVLLVLAPAPGPAPVLEFSPTRLWIFLVISRVTNPGLFESRMGVGALLFGFTLMAGLWPSTAG